MIYKAKKTDASCIAEIAIMLWQNHTMEELVVEFEEILDREDSAIYLLYEEAYPIGFAQCQLRNDYVEGTKSKPVGYLEGIFVRQEYRNKGYARELLKNCENWAKEKGCIEFASDCELTNSESLKFHLKMGFTEANRIICFTKHL